MVGVLIQCETLSPTHGPETPMLTSALGGATAPAPCPGLPISKAASVLVAKARAGFWDGATLPQPQPRDVAADGAGLALS